MHTHTDMLIKTIPCFHSVYDGVAMMKPLWQFDECGVSKAKWLHRPSQLSWDVVHLIIIYNDHHRRLWLELSADTQSFCLTILSRPVSSRCTALTVAVTRAGIRWKKVDSNIQPRKYLNIDLTINWNLFHFKWFWLGLQIDWKFSSRLIAWL